MMNITEPGKMKAYILAQAITSDARRKKDRQTFELNGGTYSRVVIKKFIKTLGRNFYGVKVGFEPENKKLIMQYDNCVFEFNNLRR